MLKLIHKRFGELCEFLVVLFMFKNIILSENTLISDGLLYVRIILYMHVGLQSILSVLLHYDKFCLSKLVKDCTIIRFF